MRRFKWRLQRVLDIKQKEEQVKRAELLGITERLGQIRGELFMQKRIIEDLIDGLSEEDPRNRVGRQAFFLNYSATNDAKIKNLERGIETLETQQKEKMAEILTIKRLNEGLEKLRSQAKTEFVMVQEKLEQNEMDETSTSRFARKMIEKNKIEDFSSNQV
jgi:flagellar biosynthesis chaperone FliJ